jgi:trigger factor
MEMQISVEEIEGLYRRMTVELPADNYESAVKNKLQRIGKTAKVKGFRPGKVPMSVLESKYGAEVRREAFSEAVESSLYEALTKENLRPAGRPDIEAQPVESGKGLRYTATFEIYPQFEVAPVDGITIDRPVVEISDADIDNVIDTIRRQRMTWQPVERAASEGDQVIIDFRGTIDGEPFGGGEAHGVPLVLGSGAMIPGFEDQLKGASAGDDVTVKISFPDDYHGTEVAGKDAEFAVKVQSVNESVLPEVDEDFVKSFGVASGSLDDFRREVRNNMQRELDETVRQNLKRQVTDALVESNAIEIPKTLLEQESEQLLNNARRDLAARGMSEQQGTQLQATMFEEEAKRRVVLGLILSEIISKNEMKADPVKVREAVEQHASTYEKPADVVKWYYDHPEHMSGIEFYVLENEVVDWVMKQATVTDKPVGFNEFMHPTGSTGG